MLTICFHWHRRQRSDRMFSFVFVVLLVHATRSSVALPIVAYRNAQFVPTDPSSVLADLSSVESGDACLCQCSQTMICSVATYIAADRWCSLFVGPIDQGHLRMGSAIVYSLGNRSIHGASLKRVTVDNLQAIWNTTAGGDSLPSTPGWTTGTYWPSEPANDLFDGNLSTPYTNHGMCNSSASSRTLECGENTGLYLTLKNTSIVLAAFLVGTNNWLSSRDPLTFTVEGSNLHGTALTLGTSWTLIYNGSSGLVPDPGLARLGTLVLLDNPSMSFGSYRFLTTSKRGIGTSMSYSELLLFF